MSNVSEDIFKTLAQGKALKVQKTNIYIRGLNLTQNHDNCVKYTTAVQRHAVE